MSGYFAAVDCGTTLIKSALVGPDGRAVGLGTRPCPCLREAGGRIEMDPAVLWRGCTDSLREAVEQSGVRPGAVEALCVTNQRATVLCLDGAGEPLGPALSWQDMRGAPQVDTLRRRFSDRRFYRLAGLPLDPVFTLGKILWLREREPERFAATRRFALVQDFVLRALGAEGWFCDHSNASLTGLFDVARLDWSGPLLDLAGLTRDRLPLLVPSARRVGSLSASGARLTGLPEGLPLVSGGGDQQCAAVGSGAVEPGIIEVTLGTAAALVADAAVPALDPKRRVSCCAHAAPGRWEVEGFQSSAGVCLEWLAGQVNGGRRFPAEFLDEVSSLHPGAEGVMFLPYLAGASAPHWLPAASGGFLGLHLGHRPPHLARAVLEGVTFQMREILEVLVSLEIPLRELRLTGAASQLDVWSQMQADVHGLPVATLENPQATLLGAAILGACGVGAFSDVPRAVRAMVRTASRFVPDPERAGRYDSLYRRYQSAHRSFVRSGLFGTVANLD